MRAIAGRAAFMLALLAPAPALAHADYHDPAEPYGWTWDPTILVPLVVSLTIFGLGWWRLRSRSNRGVAGLDRRAALFGMGWAWLAAALVSPLHEGGEHSFTLHMIEHELLMLVAAPMLVLARPLAIMLWAWPPKLRQSLGRWSAAPAVAILWRSATAPVAATLLQAAALWLWHAPALFDLALAHEGWHIAQHLSFIVAALLFWTATLNIHPRSPRAVRAVSVLCLFATSVVTGALGALMAVSASPWYQGYARLGMAPLGLSPAEDQQLAGLIMWVPGGLVHAFAALLVMRSLLRAPEELRSHAV